MTPSLNRNFSSPLKSVSTVLITAALGLELGNLGTRIFLGFPMQGLDSVFSVERVVLAIHAVEGAIAAAYAGSRGHSPWGYGIYTFFVGAFGLSELFKKQAEEPDPNSR